MLDAAHGKAVGTAAGVDWIHDTGLETQIARSNVACRSRRGGPTLTIRADTRQRSRRGLAVARSRRMKQSLE